MVIMHYNAMQHSSHGHGLLKCVSKKLLLRLTITITASQLYQLSRVKYQPAL